MLRILTSLIRNAPGPFRGARALAADMVEGLIDVVQPPPEAAPPPPPAPPPPAPTVDEAPKAAKAEPVKEAAAPQPKAAPKGSEEQAKAFKQAIGRADWVRRQDFKVLAIFWEARRQGLGSLTAKKASALGADLGLTIRHENVRKVVRTRLTDKVETSTVPNSQPPTFEYEMLDGGAEFFESEYLAKV